MPGTSGAFSKPVPTCARGTDFALALLKLGEEDAAIDAFRAMLKLNPNDNQGIRYLLLGCLLRRDDVAAVKKLLADYNDEWSAYWLYTRALIAFRDGQAAATATLRLLQDAWSANEHVPAILAGTKPPVISDSGYITVGRSGRSNRLRERMRRAWRKTPGAIKWLTTADPPSLGKRRPAKLPVGRA